MLRALAPVGQLAIALMLARAGVPFQAAWDQTPQHDASQLRQRAAVSEWVSNRQYNFLHQLGGRGHFSTTKFVKLVRGERGEGFTHVGVATTTRRFSKIMRLHIYSSTIKLASADAGVGGEGSRGLRRR